MKALFAPAMMLIGRLRYPYKFSLIFVVFVLPLLVLSSFLIAEINARVEFMEQERRGLEYITVVRQLVERVPAHRGMTNAYLRGDASFKERILAKRTEIDDQFAALTKVDQRLAQASTGLFIMGYGYHWSGGNPGPAAAWPKNCPALPRN